MADTTYWKMTGPLADDIGTGVAWEAYLPAFDFPPHNGYVNLVPVPVGALLVEECVECGGEGWLAGIPPVWDSRNPPAETCQRCHGRGYERASLIKDREAAAKRIALLLIEWDDSGTWPLLDDRSDICYAEAGRLLLAAAVGEYTT